MTDFPIHTTETAPEASRARLQGAQDALGFIPNLYATMAEAPAVLEGYQTLADIFGKSDLNATELQVIMMTNNVKNGCEYCMAAQTVLEVVLGTGLKVISNYTNHIASTPVDAAFAPNAWTKAA